MKAGKVLLLSLILLAPFYSNAQSGRDGAKERKTDYVYGKITEMSGQALEGVSVRVSGSKLGAITDSDGAFHLDIPWGFDSLLITHIGFETRRIPAYHGAPILLRLEAENYRLDEVQIVGFGTQERDQVTGAISSVGEEAFKNVSVTSWQSAIQGRLPGVSVTSNTGAPESPSSIRIRGVGSITAGNQPLIVVDGIIMSGLSGVNRFKTPYNDPTWNPTNPFIGINNSDIASVEVLKDAAAATIYGARGSNGVILITTKSGQFNSRPRVHLNYYAGFQEVSNRWDLLNGQEYAGLWNEASVNVGDSSNLYNPATEPSVDWQGSIFQKGFVNEANAGVSGGSEDTRYFLNATYRSEEGYLISTGLTRLALKSEIEQKIGDKWKVGLSIMPSLIENQRTGNVQASSPFGLAAWFAPNLEPYDSTGQLIRDPLYSSNGDGPWRGNALATLTGQEIKVVTNQLLSRLHLNYSPIPEVSLLAVLGTELSQVSENSWNAPGTWRGRSDGLISEMNQDVRNYQLIGQADYSSRWKGVHRLNATVGLQYTYTRFSGNAAEGTGVPGSQINSLLSAAQINSYTSWESESAFLGTFARVDYSIRNTLLFSLTGRYDGSSRFGINNRYGFFPAFSAGWVMSNESFLQASWLNLLKLRSSIGLTGNAEIGDYASIGQVSYDYDYLNQPGLVIRSLGNSDLTWEKALQWNVGLDYSLFGGRLSGSLEYYIRDTYDLLLDVPVPWTNGVGTVLRNVGSVRNQGFEFAIDALLVQSKHFRWSLQINGATVQNKVLKLTDFNGDGKDEDILSYPQIFRTGEAIGSYYLVKYAGVDPETGDALFYNREGDISSTYSAENRQVLGGGIPKFSGGLGTSVEFRGFDLSLFFLGKMGHQIFVISNALEGNMQWGLNQTRSQLNAWRPDNRDTDVPQARLYTSNGGQPSTRYLQNANFLRLNHLSFGYTFARWGKSGNQVRIYAAGQNLLVWTSFTGLDPDSEYSQTDAAAQGRVYYNTPARRTISFGFNMTL